MKRYIKKVVKQPIFFLNVAQVMLREKATGILLLQIFIISISFKPSTEEGIKISIPNLRNNKGNVLVSLFKDGVGYPENADNAFRKTKLTIKNNKASVLFPNLPSGNYAIAILHDENDDNKMNKNGLGLPKEGYGFSNNAVGAFGPPSWKKASFKHASGTLSQKDIRARY